jgi:fibronectin-binding autotransporter adhesin
MSTLLACRLRRHLIISVVLFSLSPLWVLAQIIDGSGSTTGSTVDGSGSTTGSTVDGSGSTTGSTVDGSGGTVGSGTVGSGTTSYDAPNSYDLGGATVTLATAILNGGTVTNGTLSASTEVLAYSGSVTAQLTSSGALTKSTAGTLVLAGQTNLSGGAFINEGTLQIGDGTNTASFSGAITNNATVVFKRGGDFTFSNAISGSGSLVHEGSILRLTVPTTYTGNTTISSGILVLATSANQGLSSATRVALASGASLDISNRAQTITGLTGAGSIYSYGGSAGSLTVSTPGSERQTFSGTLGGSFPDFSFAKSGTGTLALSGTNNYTGTTTVSGGTLLINGSIGNTATTVANGGTLGGTGSIGGLTTVESGGSLSPGDTVGTLTFANGLTLNSGSILNFDLGSTSDLLRISDGTLTGPLVGNVTVNVYDSGSFTPATYTLFNFAGATTADFNASGFAIGVAPGGMSYSFGLTADSLQLTVTAVPEPATAAAALGGVALVALLVRRRQRLRRTEPNR